MIKKLLLFATITYSSFNSFGQCCPYVDPIEIIPVSPYSTDSIYVVTNVTTPNAGAYLGYSIIDLGSTIRIEACYFSGMLTVLQSYTDTINLGVKPGGTYAIEFVAYQSGSNLICDYSDSNEVAGSITVIDNSGIGETEIENSINVYPNPVADGLLYLNSKNVVETIRYELFNALGELVLKGSADAQVPINVGNYSGVFYLSIFTSQGIETKKILIQ